MSDIRTIETVTHGRYLIDVPASAGPHPVVVGFHGYGEDAEAQLVQLRAIVGHRQWLIVSVQALHRFYTRRDESVVASWMTRQDRELAIADNIAYVAAVVAEVRRDHPTTGALVYVGFSQGAAMAYRAAAFAGPRVTALIVLAGDIPPDVGSVASTLPPVLIGRGSADSWYTKTRGEADLAQLRDAGVHAIEHVFDNGHVWDSSFVSRAGTFLDANSSSARLV